MDVHGLSLCHLSAGESEKPQPATDLWGILQRGSTYSGQWPDQISFWPNLMVLSYTWRSSWMSPFNPQNCGIPHDNQTWQWNMDHLSMIFLLTPPFIGEFPASHVQCNQPMIAAPMCPVQHWIAAQFHQGSELRSLGWLLKSQRCPFIKHV